MLCRTNSYNVFYFVHQVSKQLFEPLTMQIIHWLTSNKRPENSETMALLDSIYVSVDWIIKIVLDRLQGSIN